MKNASTVFFIIIFSFAVNVEAAYGNNCVSSSGNTIKVPSQFQTINDAIKESKQEKYSLQTVIIDVTAKISEKTNIPYSEQLILDNNTARSKLCIKAAGTVKPVIEWKFPTLDKPDIVSIENISEVTIDGFEIQGDFVKNKDCDSKGKRFAPAGINVKQAASSIDILNNEIRTIGHDYEVCKTGGNAYGIVVKSVTSVIDDVSITGNNLSDLNLGKSESLTINGNVTNFEIINNTISNVDNIGIDIIGGEDSKHQPKVGKITDNKIYKLVGCREKVCTEHNPGQSKTFPFIAGIYIDGGTGKSKALNEILWIENNVIHDFGVGIKLGGENSYCKDHEDECKGDKVKTQFVTVKNNVIFGNRLYGIGMGKDSPEQDSYTWECDISNNTVYGNHSYVEEGFYGEINFASLNSDTIKKLTFTNNIVYATYSKYVVVSSGDFKGPDVIFTGNVFYRDSIETFIWKWNKPYKLTDLFNADGISIFDNVYLKGSNNMWRKPDFENPIPAKKEDFKLKKDSSLKEKGALIF